MVFRIRTKEEDVQIKEETQKQDPLQADLPKEDSPLEMSDHSVHMESASVAAQEKEERKKEPLTAEGEARLENSIEEGMRATFQKKPRSIKEESSSPSAIAGSHLTANASHPKDGKERFSATEVREDPMTEEEKQQAREKMKEQAARWSEQNRAQKASAGKRPKFGRVRSTLFFLTWIVGILFVVGLHRQWYPTWTMIRVMYTAAWGLLALSMLWVFLDICGALLTSKSKLGSLSLLIHSLFFVLAVVPCVFLARGVFYEPFYVIAFFDSPLMWRLLQLTWGALFFVTCMSPFLTVEDTEAKR